MKKPQLEVGQIWVTADDMTVRITRWGQDGGGGGIVWYTDIEDPESEFSQFGKGFRDTARPVLEVECDLSVNRTHH